MKKELNAFYIVKKNDTINNIAKKYQTNSISILILNNLTPQNIKEGCILFIK